MKYLLFFCFFFSISITAYSQTIRGEWNGMLYQSEGGLSERYYFSMHLAQDDGKIRGVTKINVLNKPNTSARMEFTGTFDGRFLRFEEIKIIEEAISGGEWCLKKGKLELSLGKEGFCLEGSWGGVLSKSGSFCSPGRIKVCQLVPIAH